MTDDDLRTVTEAEADNQAATAHPGGLAEGFRLLRESLTEEQRQSFAAVLAENRLTLDDLAAAEARGREQGRREAVVALNAEAKRREVEGDYPELHLSVAGALRFAATELAIWVSTGGPE